MKKRTYLTLLIAVPTTMLSFVDTATSQSRTNLRRVARDRCSEFRFDRSDYTKCISDSVNGRGAFEGLVDLSRYEQLRCEFGDARCKLLNVSPTPNPNATIRPSFTAEQLGWTTVDRFQENNQNSTGVNFNSQFGLQQQPAIIPIVSPQNQQINNNSSGDFGNFTSCSQLSDGSFNCRF